MSKPVETILVSMRLPKELIARADAFAAQFKARNPGAEMTRTGAVIALVSAGLKTLASKKLGDS